MSAKPNSSGGVEKDPPPANPEEQPPYQQDPEVVPGRNLGKKDPQPPTFPTRRVKPARVSRGKNSKNKLELKLKRQHPLNLNLKS